MLRATTSASNVFRRKLCPGSEAMEHGLKDEDSAISLDGTLLHAYDANPDLERAVLKPNQQDLLKIAAELDDVVFARVFDQFGVVPLIHPAPGSWREKELLALRGTDFETPGHCDRVHYFGSQKLAVVIDKKYGFLEVTPAAANDQLRAYAIGASEEWDCDNVVVAITQPRLPYAQRLTMASYSRDDIELSRAELISIRKASRVKDAPLVAGEEQCRYCKAKAKCPAFTKQLVPLDVGKEIVNALDQLAPDKRDALIRACRFADFIKEAVMDNERSVIAAGGESFYAMGKAQEMRDVVDTKRAVALLALRGDLTRDDVLAACTLHFGPLEEKYRAKKKCTWNVAKDAINETLGSVIERKAKKAALVRKKELVLP